MPKPNLHSGLVASLIDRLIDNEPNERTEIRPLRGLPIEKIKESIRNEVSRLFNTRLDPRHVHEIGGRRTVLDYGVADYSGFYPPNQENQQRLRASLLESLAAFEPRLKNIRVEVGRHPDENVLLVRIDGVLIVESVREPVSFPVIIRNGDAVIEVQQSE